jgi:hypothetical protein
MALYAYIFAYYGTNISFYECYNTVGPFSKVYIFDTMVGFS